MSDLAPGRSKNFQIKEDFKFGPYNDERTLSAWSYVRPISLDYVPRHVKDADINKSFDKTKETYAFCRYGTIRIPLNIIIEVS